MIAAARGGDVSGVDIASNLIVQARARAAEAGLTIAYYEGDAEALPFASAQFDVVASMFGVMFAPRHECAAQELLRVTKPGGLIASANWTPEGFIGLMFEVFRRYLPAPTSPAASPMDWGVERNVQALFGQGVSNFTAVRRLARLRYPFPPAETVDFLRKYYGPTQRAFASLAQREQTALRDDLVRFQSEANISADPNWTDTPSEYLEVLAIRAK